jgi:ferredoxin
MVVVVDARACVRCGACATVAPSVFILTRKGVQVAAERSDPRVRVAIAICPMQAIAAS